METRLFADRCCPSVFLSPGRVIYFLVYKSSLLSPLSFFLTYFAFSQDLSMLKARGVMLMY